MRKSLFSFVLYKTPFLFPLLEKALYRAQLALLAFYEKPDVYALIRSVYREGRILVQPFEARLVYHLAAMRSRCPGSMAELGVAGGGTAKLICSAAGEKPFFGFDTFAGLPPVRKEDRHWGVRFFKERQFAAEEQAVRAYLAPFEKASLVAGHFPESAGNLEDERFAFVHLDADLYESTAAGLRFFWPRMTTGGVILLHDSHAEGVRRAIEEFLNEHPDCPSFTAVCSQFVILKP